MSIFIPIVSEFKSDGIDKARKEFASLKTVGEKASFAIKKAAVPAAAAIGGLAVALGDAVKGAMEDQAASQELARTLSISASATDEQIASTEKWIEYMGKAYGVADDDLRPALASLSRATYDVQEAQKASALAMDISAATGKDLGSVADALAKAYGGNMKALQKLDPSLKGMIKDGASLDEVFAALGGTFGGATAEAANTAAGRMKRFQLSLAETKESIGAALLPAVEALLPVLMGFATWAQDNKGVFLAIAGTIGVLSAAVLAFNAYLKVAAAITALQTAATAAWNAVLMANPLTLFIVALVAVGAALVVAYKKFETFRNIVDGVFSFIKSAAKVGIDFITDYVKAILSVYKTIFNGIATLWNNTFGKLSFKVPSWVPGLGGKGFEVPDIPLLADGGIVTGPTLAMIGEAGPEAVIPLDRLRGAGAGGNTYQITVQGGDPNAIVDALRRYMRQNGSVPIKVAG